MIFKQWEQVLDGSKTQTRRPMKEGEFAPLVINGEILAVLTSRGITKWQVGRTYAVQPGRGKKSVGKKSVGRIRITKIRRERLQKISQEDIRAEGIPEHSAAWVRLDNFRELWESIYRQPHYRYSGYRWRDNPDVWVLDFELVTNSPK